MADLLKLEDRRLLEQELTDAFQTIDELRTWLHLHYPAGLPELRAGGLRTELTNLFTWADAVDGMRALLQRFADHSPDSRIPFMIYAYTHAEIKQQSIKNRGLPDVPPEKNWFAASRPFVNRAALRDHLKQLENSDGAESVLIINGEARTGKSFAVSLALGFEAAKKSEAPLDIDAFAKSGALLNARVFAALIAGDDQGCPSFDETKEDETVPRIMVWLTNRLRHKRRWIIIDHCNRRILTQGARTILTDLAAQLRKGALPQTRLILIDFDLNELPLEWRDLVRHDRAVLPDEQRVAEWCQQLAAAAKRQHAPDAPAEWASQIFVGLCDCSLTDGTWHIALERQLRKAVDRIMACAEKP